MVLEVHNVTKSYPGADGPVPVLRGVDLRLGAGETLALTGESGSGKSTLLHLVGGLDAVDAGRITVDGRDLTGLDDRARAALRRDVVGVIFQQFNLIPSLTVEANIAFQARLGGRHDPARAAGLAVGVWVSKSLPGCDLLPSWCEFAERGVDFFTSDLPPAVWEWHASRGRPLKAAI